MCKQHDYDGVKCRRLDKCSFKASQNNIKLVCGTISNTTFELPTYLGEEGITGTGKSKDNGGSANVEDGNCQSRCGQFCRSEVATEEQTYGTVQEENHTVDNLKLEPNMSLFSKKTFIWRYQCLWVTSRTLFMKPGENYLQLMPWNWIWIWIHGTVTVRNLNQLAKNLHFHTYENLVNGFLRVVQMLLQVSPSFAGLLASTVKRLHC